VVAVGKTAEPEVSVIVWVKDTIHGDGVGIDGAITGKSKMAIPRILGISGHPYFISI
jgi:hypothetical protein